MSRKQRIMLLEVTPLVPQPIVYATLDPATKGSGVTLSGGDLVIVSTTSTSSGRARSTVPLTSGEYYWETTLTTAGTSGFVSSCGVLEANQPMTSATFGFDGFNSAAAPYWVSGNAWIYWNSTMIASLGAHPITTIVRHWYNADTGLYQIAVNGGAWTTVHNRVKQTQLLMYAGAAVARLTKWTFNFGASAFAYAVPVTSRAGVYADPELTPTTLYLSSTKFSGDPGSGEVGYLARISSKRDLQSARQASCYVWESQTRSSRGGVSLVNTDGGLDDWAEYVWTDAPARVLSGYEGDVYGDFVEESTEIVGNVSRDKTFFDIEFMDTLTMMDIAVPRGMYTASNANEVTINTPYPKVFGYPQYCEGVFRSTATTGNDAYAIDFTDSSDVIELLLAYDKGDVFDHLPSGGARDYWMTQDGIGIKLQNAPAGTITAKPYGPFLYDNGSTDRITGGSPFAGWSTPPTYNSPTSWTKTGAAWTANNHFKNGTLGFGPSGSAHAYTTGAQAAMYNSATSIAAGKVVIEFTVEVMTTAAYMAFVLGAATYYVRIDRVGKMRLAFTNPAIAQLVIHIGTTGTYVLGACNFVFSNFKAFDASVPEYLPEWLDLFANDYCGVTVDSSAVSTFVTNQNWKLAHYSKAEETVLSIIRKTMDGWIGWAIPKRDGTLTVGQVIDPDTVTADFSFSSPQIKSVNDEEDKAPGLTTRIAGRKNNKVTSVDQIAAGATAAVRAELQKEFMIIRAAGASRSSIGFLSPSANDFRPVSDQFKQADGSPPKETLLQEEDAIQTTANKGSSLWKPKRKFYDVEIVLDAAIANQLEPGMVLNITWDRLGLEDGKNMLLLWVVSGFWSQKVKLRLWR